MTALIRALYLLLAGPPTRRRTLGMMADGRRRLLRKVGRRLRRGVRGVDITAGDSGWGTAAGAAGHRRRTGPRVAGRLMQVLRGPRCRTRGGHGGARQPRPVDDDRCQQRRAGWPTPIARYLAKADGRNRMGQAAG